MPVLNTAQLVASTAPQPLTPTSASSHLKCSGDCCGCARFVQGTVSRTYCRCGHPIAWHGPSTRSGSGSLSVNVSAPPRSASVPSSPSGSPTSSPTGSSSRTQPLPAAPIAKAALEQRRPSAFPPPLPATAPPTVPPHPSYPVAQASSAYPVAHAQSVVGDGGAVRPSTLRQGTLYSNYLLQHGLMPTAPPPTPPQSVLPLPTRTSVPPPPLPVHVAGRSLSVTSAVPAPSSPAPVPSSPFDPSGNSPSGTFSPAVHSASFSCSPSSAVHDASPKKPPPPPVPLFSSSQLPSLTAAVNDGVAVAPALPSRSSPMRTNRPPPIIPPVSASAPAPSTSPPPLPAVISVSAPTHRSLPSDSFSTHLHHLPDVASAHSQSGLALTKRCRSFFRHYSQLQQRHAADVERLISHEMGKLSLLGEDAMGSAGRVWQSVLMKVGMEGVLQAGYGGDVMMQCEEQLERFEQVGALLSREHEAEVRRYAALMDKVRVQVEKEREVTRQALASLAHRKEKEHHDGVGLSAAMHAAAMLNGGVDGARRKALRCCEAYQRELDAANVTYQQHTHRDLPALLTQMQSLEEMRLQSLHAALSTFASLHAAHAKAVRDVSADVKSLVATVSAEHDIKDFIARVIQQHGPPLPSQPFYYDCSVTPSELRQEIDAEEKRSTTTTASAAVEVRRPSLFHTSLEGVMEYERAMFEEAGKESTAASYASYPPDVPRILPVLIAAIEGMGGLTSEGIFRLSVSSEELHAVRKTLERGDYHLSSIDNPNVPAAVLKAWLRDLSSPLIPFAAYDRCIELGKTSVEAMFDAQPPNPALSGLLGLIQSFPPLNRRVLFYLMAFLHRLSLPPHVELSRMTPFNLAIVFSPTLLRSESNDAVVLMRDSKWGCGFIALLMESVGRGVGWEEERAWRARWEARAAPAPSPPSGGGRVPRPSVAPPPVPAEYLSPNGSPPPSPGLVGGRVQHLSFAEQHAVHTPRSSVAAPSPPITVQAPTAVEPRHLSESSETPALPEHWRAILDGATGQIYYANVVTSETQWARPC